MQDHHSTSILSIIYENKGKSISTQGLTYQLFVSKLIRTYRLNHKNYYHLYYQDEDEDFITVQTQQDFQIFIRSKCPKKMYLDDAKDYHYHFNKRANSNYEPIKKPHLQEIITKKEEYFRQKLQHFKNELEAKVLDDVKRAFAKIEEDRKKSQGWRYFDNLYCSECPGLKPIFGPAYECAICRYRLCHECQKQADHIHPFIKIRNDHQLLSKKDNMLFYGDDDLKQILKQRKQSMGKDQLQPEY